ncbi:MAG TPA: hypothetical protein VF377_08920 [Acidimicrobiia bacterium]
MTVAEARAVIDRIRRGLSVSDQEMMTAVNVLVAAGEMQQPAGATPDAIRSAISISSDDDEDSTRQQPAAETEEVGEEGSQQRDEEIAAAVQRLAQGSPAPGDEELLDQASPAELIAAAVKAQMGVPDYSWVYNEGLILPGKLDDPDRLLRLYEFFADPDVGLIQDTSVTLRRTPAERQPAALSDEEKIGTVQRILSEAPNNPVVRAALQAFAEQEKIYKPESDLLNIMNEFGLDRAKAKALIELSRTQEVDPERVAEVYKHQAGLDPDRGGWAAEMGFNRMSFVTIAHRYKEGLDIYGTHLLAAVHANDPSLAARLVNDPWALDSGEIDRVLGMVAADDPRNADDPQIQWLKNRKMGEYNIAVPVDEDSIREAVTTLAAAWNLTTNMDPITESVVREVVAGAVAQARAAMPNPFGGMRDDMSVVDVVNNVTANVAARLRALPEYQLLFRHMRPGESEEEFVQRFERRTQELFGEDLIDPTRIGMMAGNTNAVYQAGITTDIGEDNTRWQEMMARNADLFRRLL